MPGLVLLVNTWNCWISYKNGYARLLIFTYCSLYIVGRCSCKLVQLITIRSSRGNPTRCSNRLYDFSVTVPKCYKDVYVNCFFPRTARL